MKRKRRYGVYRKGRNWFIDYYYNYKRVRRSIGPSKKLAENALRKVKVEIAEGKYLDKQTVEKVKFEDFGEKYLKLHCRTNHKAGSVKKDRNNIDILNRYFYGKYLQNITLLAIEKFKADRIEEVSPATVNRRIACLKSMFNRAIEWGIATENPARKVKLLRENNKRFRYLDKEEIEKLLKHSDGYIRGIIIMAINTGMRRGEIFGLKWQDIDFKNGIIHIMDSKSGEKREIPMNEAVRRLFISIEKRKDSPYIFCKRDGGPRADIRKSFLQAQKNSGILNFRFHDLRHTFASQLRMAGVDLYTIQELLGHKTITMTQRYSHLSPDHRKRAVDVLDKRIDTKETPRQEISTFDEFDILHNQLENKELV